MGRRVAVRGCKSGPPRARDSQRDGFRCFSTNETAGVLAILCRLAARLPGRFGTPARTRQGRRCIT